MMSDEQSNTSESEDEPKEKDPEKLGTITLKYCYTIGLIHAGILAKPPNWDGERLKKTCSKRTREDYARILSEIKIRKFELMSDRINGRVRRSLRGWRWKFWILLKVIPDGLSIRACYEYYVQKKSDLEV